MKKVVRNLCKRKFKNDQTKGEMNRIKTKAERGEKRTKNKEFIKLNICNNQTPIQKPYQWFRENESNQNSDQKLNGTD